MQLTSEQFIEQIGEIEFIGPLTGCNKNLDFIIAFLNFISNDNEALFKRFEKIYSQQLTNHPVQINHEVVIPNAELLLSLVAKIANHIVDSIPADLMEQTYQSNECGHQGVLALIPILNSLDISEKAIIQNNGAAAIDEIFSEVETDMNIINRTFACR